MLFKEFNLHQIFNDISRSISAYHPPKNFMLDDETVEAYLTNEEYGKYFIPGYESLSLWIIQLFKSGRGGYIVNYVHDYGINRYVSGFETKEELLHYANYTLEQGLIALKALKETLYQLKEIEDRLTEEEIFDKNLNYMKTELKIYENIFDVEAKAPYCEQLKTLQTVQTTYNNFLETYQLIYPIYANLKELGECKVAS